MSDTCALGGDGIGCATALANGNLKLRGVGKHQRLSTHATIDFAGHFMLIMPPRLCLAERTAMNVNIENTSALRRKMTIEIEPDEIKRELDRAYNELKRSVVLKGFRPGHAPRPLLERFFGDQVRGDVIQKLVKEYTEKALEENSLTPVIQPEIVTEETDLKKALKFSAVFDLKPELQVKDYQDLKVQTPTIEVTDEEVDAELERMRERRGVLKKVEDRDRRRRKTISSSPRSRPSRTARRSTGTKVDDRLLKVSKETLAHGLDEVLIGAEVGVEVRKPRSYPADYVEKEVAGKNVEWRATVKEIYNHVRARTRRRVRQGRGRSTNLDALRAKAARSPRDARAATRPTPARVRDCSI